MAFPKTAFKCGAVAYKIFVSKVKGQLLNCTKAGNAKGSWDLAQFGVFCGWGLQVSLCSTGWVCFIVLAAVVICGSILETPKFI